MNFVYGLSMTVMGVICFVLGYRSFKTARASKRWPSVAGKVISSGTKAMSTLGDGPATASAITYQYTVDGVDYTADRVSVGQYGTGGGGHARAEAAKYPEGQTVTVYYAPADPAQAVLEPGGAIFLSAFLLFFAAITLPFGLLFLLAGIGGLWSR